MYIKNSLAHNDGEKGIPSVALVYSASLCCGDFMWDTFMISKAFGVS